jgi:hypothetical protein
MQEDVKKIKKYLVDKYTGKFEKVITQEILSAINSLKGNGKTIENKNRLSLAEIEDRVAGKIRKAAEAGDRSPRGGNSALRESSKLANVSPNRGSATSNHVNSALSSHQAGRSI